MTDRGAERPSSAANERELDAAVAALLVAAGARPEMPAAELAAVRATARAAFRAEHERRARRARRRRWSLALAAAAAVAAGAGLWLAGRPGAAPAAPAVARVELVRGDAALSATAGEVAVRPAAGDVVAAGSTLTTGAGTTPSRLALGFADRLSVRLDAASRLRVLSDRRVRLERGAIYVDAGPGGAAAAALAVETEHGTFHHLGTQFEVRLLETASDGVRLRVREGHVALEGPQGRSEAAAGEELRVGRDGTLERGSSSGWGAEWAWALDAAPLPPFEGWTVARFLGWYGRESGLVVDYRDPAAAETAARVRVHGALAELTAEEAAEVVLASAGFRARSDGGRLVVEAESLSPAP